MVIRSLMPGIAAALLAACAVGPDYVRPDLEAPPGYARADREAYTTLEAESEFWHRFDDPLLAQLVEQSLASNNDLHATLARLDQARALARHSRFDRWPTVTAAAGAANARSSADQAPGADRDARDADSYDAGIEAFWELDFFGRVRRSVEAQDAQTQATAADLAALQVAVAGEVAQSYFQLRGAQARLQVARDNAENQGRSLDLVTAQLDAGQGTEFDTARARAQLESTLSRVPALETEVALATHRIAVLTGREPGALIDVLETDAIAAPLPEQVAVGIPGELLRRRPDIVAAERRLAAATARVGIATADLFPRFTLTGLLGTQAIDADALFERDSETRLVALGIDWSFLDTGRVRARIAAAEAGAAENLANYRQAVLLALEDTENALVRYQRLRYEQSHLEEAAAAGVRAAELARLRFDGGIVNFLEVLDAERSQLEAEDALAQARARAGIALVALYRALAGGWPERLPATGDLAANQP